jgi:hypothetical protein
MIIILRNNFKKIIMNASLGSNTYRPIFLVLFAIFALIFISGCAGKKTSSSNEFTSWSAVKPNVLVHFSSGNSTAILTSGTVSQTTSDVNTNLLYDSGNNISSVTLNQTASNSVTFSVAAGDVIVKDATGANTILTNSKKTTIGILANPTAYGFEYQTYGAWGAYAAAGVGGYAISNGSLTSGGSIPTTGSAVFSGGANGYLIDGQKATYVTNASMTANVDFAARTVAFSTTNTTMTGASTGVATSIAGYNLNGTMTYSSGVNRMTGSVTSTNGMSGSIIANFYGPAANEIGGTYGLTQTTSGNSFVGGFGGKR